MSYEFYIMAILKKLITIGESKAIVIPRAYLDYYESKGKIIRKVGLEIGETIVIQPIFEDVSENESKKPKEDVLSEIESHINNPLWRRKTK